MNALAKTQTSFFKKLDAFDVEAETSYTTSPVGMSILEQEQSMPQTVIQSALSNFSSRQSSHSIVLEAAIDF